MPTGSGTGAILSESPHSNEADAAKQYPLSGTHAVICFASVDAMLFASQENVVKENEPAAVCRHLYATSAPPLRWLVG